MADRQAWIDEAAERIADGLRLIAGLKEGAEAQVRELVARVIADLDLASRDDLAEIEAMIARARAQLDALERRVAALEDAQRN